MLKIPKEKRSKYPAEYIELFLAESNALSNREPYPDDCSINTYNYLINQEFLTESVVGFASQILKGERKGGIDDTFLNLRKREKAYHGYEGVPWEILKYFMAGWCLYAPDHATTELKALSVHRDFLLALPYSSMNGRLGRLLYLWMTMKNNIQPHYFASEGADLYFSLFNSTEALEPSKRSKFLKPYYAKR